MIRDASPADFPAIRAVLTTAFPTPAEADLVERLRAEGDARVELVAYEGEGPIGCILYSPLRIERADRALDCAALAPLAVLPAYQNRGVGGRLIEAGNERCRALGLCAIIVLGHPAYYPRFGFSPEAAESLDAPFSGRSFMALALEPGALKAGGKVHYAHAFGI